MSSMEEELSTKDVREGILVMIRAGMSGEFTMPDPGMDVSECWLASMELGVTSVSWAMTKNKLSGDGEYTDLADWIGGGCTGPPELLPDHISPYWKVRTKLRLVDMVAMLDDRTVVPIKLRC